MKRSRCTEKQIIGILKEQEALALSERHACTLVGVARRVARYVSTGADNAALRQPLRELADQRRRFGYRRVGYLLGSGLIL